MTDLSWIWSAAALGLALGVLLGCWAREVRWRGAAREPMRVESGGKLYHVVAHGDVDKAREVLDWTRREQEAAILSHRFEAES
ncbi:MAG TPA: hypothetical protein VD838_02970 [Anaeromyxobacteraceae bacterium]|nr:hypothetical protein [Anaeromyxobacteraceae bacterium]